MRRIMHGSTLTISLIVGTMWQSNAQPAELKTIVDSFRLDQRLDEQVPLDLTFKDEKGANVRLGQYFSPDKPVVLSLVYYDCPSLCTEVLNGMAISFRQLPFKLGEDFESVTVSIDPTETPHLAAEKKETYLRTYPNRDRAALGWHFLTGNEGAIRPLADAVGFHYFYDSLSQQYAHPTGIMVLTPQGKVARYLYGVEYPAKDMRFALIEASQNHIGSPVDQILLLCYHYDPTTGKYGIVVMNVIRLGGVIILVVLAAIILPLLWRERRRRKSQVSTNHVDHQMLNVNSKG